MIPTGIIVSVIVVLICRLGSKQYKSKKIFPLDWIDYTVFALVLLTVIFFFKL
jgi:hypothetical protein